MPLPIYEIIPQLKAQLQTHTTLVLQAPPGAGKSTVLPIELCEEDWLNGKKIVMLEPRRLAARSVAMRMAELLEEEVGQTVGYRVRFDNKVTSSTRIEVVTEGILTRMLQQDNSLEEVGLVIFDEFHERSLHADLALALCTEAQQVLREDLRILIMSATIDGQQLSSLLNNAPVLTSQGRQYPISYQYVAPEVNQTTVQHVAQVIRRALKEQEGDILAFLPGAGEIGRVQSMLEDEAVKVWALYGDLSPAQQQQAIQPDPYGQRKVVLATSIAETSLTIEGVRIVVDSGLSRVPKFDPRSGLTRLETVKVTKDAADQRAGRAGRLGPGVCYRLWAEKTHQYLTDHRVPEIMEADLAPMVLELANWGVNDIQKLTWLTPPPLGSVAQARAVLQNLGALLDDKITARGKEMLRLPTHPRMAHMLLEGKENKAEALAADLAAILEEKDALPRDTGADLTLRLEVLRRWRAKEKVNAERAILERQERLSASWRRLLQVKQDDTSPDHALAGKLLAAAYPERIARRREGSTDRYQLCTGRSVKVDTHDPLSKEKWLVVAQLDAGTQEGKIFSAASVHPEDLKALWHEEEVVGWDDEKGILIARTETRIGDLLVSAKPLSVIPEEQRVALIVQAVQQGGLKMLKSTDVVQQWRARVNSLHRWRPEEGWPEVTEQALLAEASEWLAPYVSSVKKKEDLQKLDLYQMLNSWLPWDKAQQLDALAPARIKVPSGSEITLEYVEEGTAPILAVRLQEMFGLLDTPLVNDGRTKVMLHLLSPGYKPVQVTQDLKSFWQNTYPEVRKELRVRYSKHHWPEDPWTAEAVRGAKRKV